MSLRLALAAASVALEFAGDMKYAGEAGRQRMVADRKGNHHLGKLDYRILHIDSEQLGDREGMRQRLRAAGVPTAH